MLLKLDCHDWYLLLGDDKWCREPVCGGGAAPVTPRWRQIGEILEKGLRLEGGDDGRDEGAGMDVDCIQKRAVVHAFCSMLLTGH